MLGRFFFNRAVKALRKRAEAAEQQLTLTTSITEAETRQLNELAQQLFKSKDARVVITKNSNQTSNVEFYPGHKGPINPIYLVKIAFDLTQNIRTLKFCINADTSELSNGL